MRGIVHCTFKDNDKDKDKDKDKSKNKSKSKDKDKDRLIYTGFYVSNIKGPPAALFDEKFSLKKLLSFFLIVNVTGDICTM